VFKSYYGFLCVRYLVHATCLAILGTVHYDMGAFIGSLPQNASWSDSSTRVAAEALKQAAQATQTAASLEDYHRVLEGSQFFDLFGDQPTEDSHRAFIIMMLWKDRGSFLRLYQRGLLPGCTLLFMIALKQLPVGLDEE
ncbi:hypothetical protein FRC07_010078, partial [Ceratobasidium sp. 392]